MIYILIVTVALLILVIVYLLVDFKASRRKHEKRIAVMQDMVVHLLNNQEIQASKIKLSDDLKAKLQIANGAISQDILLLVTEFVETLAQNNLLKK